MEVLNFKQKKLKELHKDVFKLQEKYMDLLCNDGDTELTQLEHSFCEFIFQVQQEIRKESK